MVQASIEINGIAGSNDDLPINTLVQLSNADTGGELSYQWTILDAPPGSTAALSNALIENPTFTPDVEGSYLLRLVVNGSASYTDTAIAAVRSLKTRERVPAAGETDEVDTADGWAGTTGASSYLRRLDAALSDPHLCVGQVSALTSAGNFVYESGTAVLKAGLPGEEVVPVFTVTNATQAACRRRLYMFVSAVDGAPSAAGGELGIFRSGGIFPGYSSLLGVNTKLFLSDLGTVEATAGTIPRYVGYAVTATGVAIDIALDGASTDGTALDAPYLTDGVSAPLSNERNIQSLAATLLFHAAANITPLAVQKFALADTADMQQWRNHLGLVLAAIATDGSITLDSAAAQSIQKTLGNLTIDALNGNLTVQSTGGTAAFGTNNASEAFLFQNGLSKWKVNTNGDFESTGIGSPRRLVGISSPAAVNDAMSAQVYGTLSAADALAHVLATHTLTDGTSVRVKVGVVCSNATHTKVDVWTVEIAAYRSGGGAVIAGSLITGPTGNLGAGTVTVTASGNDVEITVTGDGTALLWKAVGEVITT